MGSDNLRTAADGETIPATDVNQYKSALAGDMVPRNSSGIATASAGNLGSATYPYENIYLSGEIKLGSGNFIPTGFVGQTIFATAPTGWLLANGDTIGDIGSGATHENALYEELFNLCINDFGNTGTEIWGSGDTVLLPDVRGQFMRCWDNGKGVDSGRSINTTQVDATAQNDLKTVTVTGSGSGLTGHSSIATNGGAYDNRTDLLTTTATETRPLNIAFNTIIKV